MDLSIRKYIVNNFKNSTEDEIKNSIEESIKKGEEVTLPGLGVFFEMLWNNSDDGCREKMLQMLASSFK